MFEILKDRDLRDFEREHAPTLCVSLGGSEGRFRDDMKMKETAERQRGSAKNCT